MRSNNVVKSICDALYTNQILQPLRSRSPRHPIKGNFKEIPPRHQQQRNVWTEDHHQRQELSILAHAVDLTQVQLRYQSTTMTF